MARLPGATSILLLTAVVASSACTSQEDTRLHVVVSSNMSVPDEWTTLQVTVFQFGGIVKTVEEHVRPFNANGPRLPAVVEVNGDEFTTLRAIEVEARAIFQPDDEDRSPVVRALQRVFVEPVERLASVVDLHLQWLCSEDPSVPPSDREFIGECGGDETCVGGECREVRLEEEDLPELDQQAPAEDCFDVLDCFASAELVTPDYLSAGPLFDLRIAGCTLDVPDSSRLNVGLVTLQDDPPNAGRNTPRQAGGVCFDDGVCVTPVDRHPDRGWSVSGSEVTLPHAVCRRLEQGRLARVAITHACDTKSPAATMCGDWWRRDSATEGTAPESLANVAEIPIDAGD